jgi:hypothetical protein
MFTGFVARCSVAFACAWVGGSCTPLETSYDTGEEVGPGPSTQLKSARLFAGGRQPVNPRSEWPRTLVSVYTSEVVSGIVLPRGPEPFSVKWMPLSFATDRDLSGALVRIHSLEPTRGLEPLTVRLEPSGTLVRVRLLSRYDGVSVYSNYPETRRLIYSAKFVKRPSYRLVGPVKRRRAVQRLSR